MKECEGEDCMDQLCEKCVKDKTCSFCDGTRCGYCVGHYKCGRNECNKIVCDDCVESKGEGVRCSACQKEFCSAECQFLELGEDGETACLACEKSAA